MSLLTLMRRVSLQSSLPVFDTIVSNTDRTVIELLNAAHEAGEEITRRAEWSMLYAEDTVPALATSRTLPTGFHRLIQGGAISYAASPFTPILPVKAADVWLAISNAPSAQPYYFIKSGAIRFSPAIPTGGALVRYVTGNWISSNGSPVSTFATDADTPYFTEPLLALGTLWRYKRMKGLQFDDIEAEFEAELAREIAADRGFS